MSSQAGNPLEKLNDIVLPTEVPLWLPVAPGWLALLVLTIVVFCFVYRYWQRKKHQQQRQLSWQTAVRAAIADLQSIDDFDSFRLQALTSIRGLIAHYHRSQANSDIQLYHQQLLAIVDKETADFLCFGKYENHTNSVHEDKAFYLDILQQCLALIPADDKTDNGDQGV